MALINTETILEALRLQLESLSAGDSEPLFAAVEAVIGSDSLEEELADSARFEDSLALLIYDGDRFESQLEGSKVRTTRQSEVLLLLGGRSIRGRRHAALERPEAERRLLRVKDTVANALDGLEISGGGIVTLGAGRFFQLGTRPEAFERIFWGQELSIHSGWLTRTRTRQT